MEVQQDINNQAKMMTDLALALEPGDIQNGIHGIIGLTSPALTDDELNESALNVWNRIEELCKDEYPLEEAYFWSFIELLQDGDIEDYEFPSLDPDDDHDEEPATKVTPAQSKESTQREAVLRFFDSLHPDEVDRLIQYLQNGTLINGHRRDYRDHVYHVLHTRQPEFTRDFLNHLCDLTTALRLYGKKRELAIQMKQWLADKFAMLYFTQPSTRTRLSFSSAAKRLGMEVEIIDDPAVSSEAKGESELDSIRTFSSYGDVIIMRSPISGLAAKAAAHLDKTKRRVPVVNAGGGTKSHPTQALLDDYTLDRTFRKFGRLDGKIMVITGDLAQSRTIHDLVPLFRNYPGAQLRLISHPELQMPEEILDYLRSQGVYFEIGHNLDEAVDGADGIYMTRFQKEYTDETGISRDLDLSPYYLRPHHLDHPRKVAILHPMPRGPELVAEFDEDSRVLIWRQQRNGMWVRAALLFLILWKEEYEFIFH